MRHCHGSPRQCPGGPSSSSSSSSSSCPSHVSSRRIMGGHHSCARGTGQPMNGGSQWCRTWVRSQATSVAAATAAASTSRKTTPKRMGGPWVRPHCSGPSSCWPSHGQPNVSTVHRHHQQQRGDSHGNDNRVIPRSRKRPAAVGTASLSCTRSVARLGIHPVRLHPGHFSCGNDDDEDMDLPFIPRITQQQQHRHRSKIITAITRT